MKAQLNKMGKSTQTLRKVARSYKESLKGTKSRTDIGFLKPGLTIEVSKSLLLLED